MSDRDNQIQYAKALQELKYRRSLNPVAFHEPLDYQKEFFDENITKDKRIIGILGGNKSGKSYNSIAWAIKKCIQQKRLVIIATWGTLLREISRLTYELLPKNDLISFAVYSPTNGFSKRMVRFKNGSEILFLSYDAGAEKFQAYSADIIILDEEPPEEVFDECMFRVAHTNGTIIIAATPVRGFTYLFDIFGVESLEDDSIVKWNWDSMKNIYIDQRSLKKTLDSLTDEQRAIRQHGSFANTKQGLVYYAFSYENNVVDTNPWYHDWYNPELPIKLCCDFNYSIMSWQLAQIYDDNRILVFDSVTERNANTESMCINVKNKYPAAQWEIFCDQAGSQHSSAASKTDISIIRDVFTIRPKYKHIANTKDRTESLNSLLRNSIGQHRLLIGSHNKTLIKDLQVVDWSLYSGKKQGELTHAVDGLTYMTYYEYPLNFNIKTTIL
jgi:phage terminase large subunit-like protein